MRNPPPQRINYGDGSFVYVFPDDIPLLNYRKVEFYLVKIAEQVENYFQTCSLTAESLSAGIDNLIRRLDVALFEARLRPYLQSICDLVGIKNLEDMDRVSRYRFFVGDFIPNEDNYIETAPSGLSILLGARAWEDIEESEEAKDVPTSGDKIWDIETSLLLTFKKNADHVVRTKGVVSAIAMLRQAAAQMELAHREAEKMAGKSGKSGAPSRQKAPEPSRVEAAPLEEDFAQSVGAMAGAIGLDLSEGF